jgi:Peptidoglycan-binding protein, CsiV
VKRVLAIALFCLVATLPAWAASSAKNPDLYEVEVVVFQTKLAYLEGEELWARDIVNTKLPGLAGAVTVEDSPSIDSPLWKAAGTLEADADYHVLLRKRWLQSAEPQSKTKWVYLTNRGTAADPLQLQGTIRLYQSRYLHVDIELLLREGGIREASAGQSTDASLPNVYRISEQRRIRTGKINYFDHPKFGALVWVAPVDKK